MEGDSETEQIVLRGTVTEVRPQRGAHPHQRWVAVLAIDRVVDGHFSDPAFAFRIHSPTKQDIAVGGRYELHVARHASGEYAVDRIERWSEP
jgi:hypothetical protein